MIVVKSWQDYIFAKMISRRRNNNLEEHIQGCPCGPWGSWEGPREGPRVGLLQGRLWPRLALGWGSRSETHLRIYKIQTNFKYSGWSNRTINIPANIFKIPQVLPWWSVTVINVDFVQCKLWKKSVRGKSRSLPRQLASVRPCHLDTLHVQTLHLSPTDFWQR